MALFPDATFTIFLPRDGVVPGTRVEGKLKLDVPAAIARAERLELPMAMEPATTSIGVTCS